MRQLGRHSRRVTMVRASLPLLLLVARLDTGDLLTPCCCLDTSPHLARGRRQPAVPEDEERHSGGAG